MDNEMKPQIITGPVCYVCPMCGPAVMGFAGRIVPVVCANCRASALAPQGKEDSK